MLNEDL